MECEWTLDADIEECDENERVDAGGEVGSGTSCGGSWEKLGVAGWETEKLMEGRRDARVVARERGGRFVLGKAGGKEGDAGDGGEKIADSDGGAGFAKPDTLALIRKEPEPESRFTEGMESPFGILLASIRGRDVVGGDAVELDGSTGVEESMEEILPCRVRSACAIVLEALTSGARDVACFKLDWSLVGEPGRIFAGEGERRAVAPASGRRAPLMPEFVVPFALLE